MSGCYVRVSSVPWLVMWTVRPFRQRSTIFTTTAESEITVTLEDEDGDAATPGDTVAFTTDNCEFGNGKNLWKVYESETVVRRRTTATRSAEVTLDCSGARRPVRPRSALALTSPVAMSTLSNVITVVGPPASLTVTRRPPWMTW